MPLRKANKRVYVKVFAFKPVTEENFQLDLFILLLLKRT
jgi:hypothetical protein